MASVRPASLRHAEVEHDDLGSGRAGAAKLVHPLGLLLLMLGGFLFLWAAYAHYSFRSLTGDDLALYVDSRVHGNYASDFWPSFTQELLGKFRPAVTPVLALMTDWFGGDYRSWKLFNSGLLAIDGALLGYLTWRLSRRSVVVTVLVVVAALSSRFAGFFVLQGYGAMESIALFWMLVTLVLIERSWARHSSILLATATVSSITAGFAHERYLVLIPFVSVAAILAPWRLPHLSRTALAVLPWMGGLCNFAVKTWLLGVDFLTPGGGGNTQGLRQVVSYFLIGLANISGYNAGPSYLSGSDAKLLGVQGWLVAACMFVPLGALGLVFVARSRRTVANGVRQVVLAGSLLAPLLLSASIQGRQEFRWLYGPFVVLLLGVAWCAGRLPSRSGLALIPILALCGSLFVDNYYRPALDNTYFITAQRAADSVRSDIVDRYAPVLDDRTTILITHGDSVFQFFYLYDGRFFDIYAPGHGPVVFVPELAQVQPQSRKSLVFELVDGVRIRRIRR